MNVLDVEEGSRWRWMEMLSMMVTVLGNGDGLKSMQKKIYWVLLASYNSIVPWICLLVKNCLAVVMVSSSWRQLTMMY